MVTKSHKVVKVLHTHTHTHTDNAINIANIRKISLENNGNINKNIETQAKEVSL